MPAETPPAGTLNTFVNASRLVTGAREAGAGSLLAALLQTRESPAGVRALLEAPADRYFAGTGLDMVRLAGARRDELADVARSVVEQFRPERILVGASAGCSIEKALIVAGQGAGVPTAAVVDHYWNLWQRFAGDTPDDRWHFCPETIFVPDERCVQRLREHACPARHIIAFDHPLMGKPAADAILSGADARMARRDVRARLGIESDTLLLVFVSETVFDDGAGWDWDQPALEQIFAAATGLARFAASLSGRGKGKVHLLLRPHPAEDHDWDSILPASVRPFVSIDTHLDKRDVLGAADMVFGLNSMLLLEAAQAGLPAFSWFPGGVYHGPRLADYRPEIRDLSSKEEVGRIIGERLARSR